MQWNRFQNVHACLWALLNSTFRFPLYNTAGAALSCLTTLHAQSLPTRLEIYLLRSVALSAAVLRFDVHIYSAFSRKPGEEL